MAILSSSSFRYLLFSCKAAIVPTGVLSMAMILKLSIPLLLTFVSELPFLWSVLLSWLSPPYSYLVINGMIMSVVVSSKLYSKLEDPMVTVKETVREQNRLEITLSVKD